DTFAGPKRVGDRLFSWRGGRWTDLFCVPQNRGALNVTAGRSVACIDRCGNGRYGFVVANYGGPFRLYELERSGRLRDVAPEAEIDGITGGRALACLPILGGRMDIFSVNENGANFLFRNDGTGRFDEIAMDCGLGDEMHHGRGVAALDADGDGRFDLAYGNWEGPHRLMAQGADGLFRDIAPEAYAEPSRVRTVIAADFDNDGFEEIFFNNIGQPNRLFGWRDGAWRRIDIGAAAEPRGLGTGAAAADIDGDGVLELLIAHGEAGVQPLTLYKARPNDHGWFRVMPLSPAGAPARGAVVTCRAGGRRMIRAVDAGSGYLCQMEPVAHFGLGLATGVEAVEVRWPDGATLRLADMAPNQQIRVAHPDA
ncbi:MAG TPA: CRTAC1 family protein, partial [Alphaproteobacteria bacterium]|nr:CRTAC1 family protein [Alphaproteobacteria bacterium]